MEKPMTSAFFFKSIKIRNFRAFNDLTVEKFKRINLISGFNGVGKSALLESLFLTLDLNNPLCVIKPLQWRGAAHSSADLERIFPNTNQPSSIRVESRTGRIDVSIEYGKPGREFVLNAEKDASLQASGLLSQISAPNIQGITLDAHFRGNITGRRQIFLFVTGNTFSSTFRTEGQELGVTATLVSHGVQSTPAEMSERVTKIIKSGRKKDLVNYLHLIDASVEDLTLLQEGAVTQVYLTTSRGLLPLPLLGGGMRALFEVASVAMTTAGGAVFFDELESSLHYSVVSELWSLIATIAYRENVQVFAVTHSKEAMTLAVEGIKKQQREKDFQYIRLSSSGATTRSTNYAFSDLMSAFEFGVEIR